MNYVTVLRSQLLILEPMVVQAEKQGHGVQVVLAARSQGKQPQPKLTVYIDNKGDGCID